MNYRSLLFVLLVSCSSIILARNRTAGFLHTEKHTSVVGEVYGGLTISGLTCEMQKGMVFVQAMPRLGWQVTSSMNGSQQSAYQIELADAFTKERLWDSGKIISSKSQLIPLEGCKRINEGRYLWRVKVWDEKGTSSDWSHDAFFYYSPKERDNHKSSFIPGVSASVPSKSALISSTSALSFHTSDFTGATAWNSDCVSAFGGCRWIGAITRKDSHLPTGRSFHGSELKRPEVKALWDVVDTLSGKSICLRKDFTVKKKLREAIVRICGLGFYELSLNGQKVGDEEFAPLWSDYDKTVYYNMYDVTRLLEKGGNAVGVLLGNGFYNVQGGGRYTKLKISFGPPTLLFQLQLCYEDGTQDLVCSDNTWKYDLSPITFNSIYGGEDYDARHAQKGWDSFGFKESTWRDVVLQEAPKGALRLQQALPVKIMERYDPVQVTRLTAAQLVSASKSTKRTVDTSALVFDMGQNLAGFPEITVRGRRGQQVTLLVSESLTDEGACNQRQTGHPYYYVYTLKGDGEEKWHPRFSYYGFRYIQVEGAVNKGEQNPGKLPVLTKIQSCFVYNSAPKVSSFECSNSIFNSVHRLIEKAVRSNMQSVFTDCPHREKLGWLEQVHLNGAGLFYNYDLTAYIPQQVRNMVDAQHDNGTMPTTAPEYVVFEGPGMDAFAESPEWGSSLVIVPFMYYGAYGDDSLIRNNYVAMRRYMDYLGIRAKNHILTFGLGDWYDYGDFRSGFSRNTPVSLVATAQYYMNIGYMIKAAALVGNRYDEQYYIRLRQEVKNAFQSEFYHEDTRQYGTGSQCSNALPLFLAIVEEKDRKAVMDNLVADIKKHGNRLTTGDVGNRYLFRVLADNGLNELMYTMQNHEDVPGYGFQLKFGATTLTEQWDPRQGSSWNHFMMGQIDEWFFRSLAGIQVRGDRTDGNSDIEIRPQPVGNLTYVRASTQTLFGKVSVDWKKQNGMFILKVQIPVGSSACVYLPGEEESKQISSGSYTFTRRL